MWIEITGPQERGSAIASRPARALWIEIQIYLFGIAAFIVEAREGLVD